MTAKPDIIDTLKTIIGPAHVLTEASATAPYLTDWRKNYTGTALAVALPSSTQEVSQIAAFCNEHRIAIVPQGGNTSLCGAATPQGNGHTIVLALSRMNGIRKFDPVSRTMTVDAGCILENIQNEADSKELYFPLDLGARGSCQIGGNLSTNAGGFNVLRYGNTRALCLGLEVVLADGKVMNLLSTLKKDNTGYDIKDLFIGAEGTLGIITGASLQLFAKHKAVATGFASLENVDDAVALLNLCEQASGGNIVAFELISQPVIDNVLKHYPEKQIPFAQTPIFSALIEIASTSDSATKQTADGALPLNTMMQDILSEALERNLIQDATIAMSQAQRAALWEVREAVPESEITEGGTHKFDISIPINHISAFYRKAADGAEAIVSGTRIFAFGHLGDGNLHYNLAEPDKGHNDFFSDDLYHAFEAMLAQLLRQYEGSISAEHGIGQQKRELLKDNKDPNALQVMAAIKASLDPHGIMNPGKVL